MQPKTQTQLKNSAFSSFLEKRHGSYIIISPYSLVCGVCVCVWGVCLYINRIPLSFPSIPLQNGCIVFKLFFLVHVL